MADNNNDNILASLKTLLWSAFIGVVSFQILAPIVWDYLHTALGVPYNVSYWLFTMIYFLVLPVFIFVWLYGKRKLIANYLPVYQRNLTHESKCFLNGILIFVALQFLVTLIGFFTKWGYPLFYIIFWLYAICCGVFLFACFWFCKLHIQYVFKAKSSLVEEEENAANAAKAKDYFKDLFSPTVIIYVLLFIVAFLFINNWISENNRRNKYSKHNSALEAGKRSFEFQQLNDSVNLISSKLAYIEDTAQLKYSNIHLDSAIGRADTIFREKIDTNRNAKLEKYLDSLKRWTMKLDLLIVELKDSAKPKPIDIKGLNDSGMFKIPDSVFMETWVTKDDLDLVGVLRIYLGAASNRITKVSKSELGIQLRAVQTKGMLMLISLFFTLLALYIFIKIINKSQTLELGQIQQQQKVENTQVIEQFMKKLEANVAESGKAGNTLWIMLTVTAWLLVPIFKMVKDEEINLGSPYKSPTFVRKGTGSLFPRSDTNTTSTTGKRDTFLIQTQFDTIKVKLVDEAPAKLDSPSIRMLLKEIKDKVNAVETKVGDVKNELSN